MTRHHADIWECVLGGFRAAQPGESVELLIIELEGQLARGEFDQYLPETKAIVETILHECMPDRFSRDEPAARD